MEAEKGLKDGDGSEASPALRAKEEGDKCRFDDCDGEYGYKRVENCYCHISPPCHNCVENPLVCLDCGDDLPDAPVVTIPPAPTLSQVYPAPGAVETVHGVSVDKVIVDSLSEAQAVVLKWLLPDSKVSGEAAMADLLPILDNKTLVLAMRKAEQRLAAPSLEGKDGGPVPLSQDRDAVAYGNGFDDWYDGYLIWCKRTHNKPFDGPAAREGWNAGIRFYAALAAPSPVEGKGPGGVARTDALYNAECWLQVAAKEYAEKSDTATFADLAYRSRIYAFLLDGSALPEAGSAGLRPQEGEEIPIWATGRFTSQFVFYNMLMAWKPEECLSFYAMLSRRPDFNPEAGKPGDDYRLLKVGDIVEASDEVYAHGCGPWSPVQEFTVGKGFIQGYNPMRRCIQAPDAARQEEGEGK